jgi:hypothetical protein
LKVYIINSITKSYIRVTEVHTRIKRVGGTCILIFKIYD